MQEAKEMPALVACGSVCMSPPQHSNEPPGQPMSPKAPPVPPRLRLSFCSQSARREEMAMVGARWHRAARRAAGREERVSQRLLLLAAGLAAP